MRRPVETSTPPGTPAPIGPYSHVARAGSLVMISATAGIDPATGELAGPDVESQTRRILESFRVMLRSVDADLTHVLAVSVFLKEIGDFAAMNRVYAEEMGEHRPARTVVAVVDLPKEGARLTMSLTAVAGSPGA